MYDREWARGVVTNYQKLCARAHQIDLCIQQRYRDVCHRECTIRDIQVVLIDSVQGKTVQKVWNDYKRLVKKTPFNKDLFERLSDTIIVKIDVDKLQRQFQWD